MNMIEHDYFPSTPYFIEARESIPEDHPHRDEIISLLIDQVLDDADYALTTSN